MGKHERNRWHLRRLGLTALVVVLGVGVWQGVAAATGGKTAKIQRNNANCGRSVGTPSIGTATFSRDGNTVIVDVNLTNGEPGFVYEIDLYMVKPNQDCKFLDDMGTLTTDELGQGRDEFTAAVDPKAQTFFIDAFEEGTDQVVHHQSIHGLGTDQRDNDSLIVKLKG